MTRLLCPVCCAHLKTRQKKDKNTKEPCTEFYCTNCGGAWRKDIYGVLRRVKT